MAMSGAESGEPAAQSALPGAPAPAEGPAAEPPAAAVGRAAVTPPPAAEPQVVFTVPSGEQHPAAPNLVAVSTGAERDAVGGGHGLPGAVVGAALRDWLAERPSRLAEIVGSQPHRTRGLSDRLRGRTNLLIMALVGLLAIGLAT